MIARTPRSRLHARLLVGASAGALVLANSSAQAGGGASNPFARTVDPAAQAARAAAAQAAQGSNATAASQRALAAFAQAAAIRRSMDAGQAAARAAAAAAQAHVPNGLGTGGLQVDPGVAGDPSLWLGAKAPTQTTGSDGRTKVDVTQTQAQAILNWQTFNVGQQTDLSFTQGASNWAVLNRVNDPNANPTQILGTIKAPGTVLIMNRNGVIFGGTAQINTGNLVAAAAAMSDDQFLKNGIYSNTSNGYVPSITDALGQVKVDAGAQITTNAPTSVTLGGGYVMLIGGSVENDGAITTPKGQTLLAAGDSFLLRPGYNTTDNSISTTRGSEIAPSIDPASSNGAVTNAGVITATQGDITLAGRTLDQSGVLLSTTSVSQRGTIHLLNSAADSLGSITLGADSLTAILPELTSTDTALDSQRDALIADSAKQDTTRRNASLGPFDDLSLLADREDQSRVEIVTGGNIAFKGGSYTLAQGGQIVATAGGRITTETGAWLDVSGVRDVALDVGSNAVLVNVQGNELRDDPVNRDDPNKPLYNAAGGGVWVNVNDLTYVPAGTGGYAADRYYTEGGLLEVSGYLSNTSHGIGEWTSVGGAITLQANEVVAQKGSMFNLSGGSLDYAAGSVMETLLQGADGKIYTADNAPANVDIVSIGQSYQVLHPRWGEQYTQTYQNPFAQKNVAVEQAGYIVGRDAGRLILGTSNLNFQGDIDAEVVSGQRQTDARASGVVDGYKASQDAVALGGELAIQSASSAAIVSPISADVTFGAGEAPAAPPQGAAAGIWLDAGALSSAQLGSLSVQTTGDIAVDAPLTVASGGKVTLGGLNVADHANITARSGSITLGETETVLTGLGTSAAPGSVDVAAGVTLDVRGVWTNQLLAPFDASGTAFVNGGNVTLQAVGDVTLEKGSVIDASSGGAILSNGATEGGAGGNIALIASMGQDLTTPNLAGKLTLDGDLRAYGVTRGGTLTLQTGQAIVIGDDNYTFDTDLAAGSTAPFTVTLASALVIPAGTALPAAFVDRIEAVPTGMPLAFAAVLSGAGDVITQADWTVPPGVFDALGGETIGVTLPTGEPTFRSPGQMVPAGSIINDAALPAGYVPPATVFGSSIKLQNPVVTTYPAGSVFDHDVTLAAGTQIPAGTILTGGAKVQPISIAKVPTGFFDSGFSNYSVNGLGGLLVADGARIAPAMATYHFNAASASKATGTDPAAVFTLAQLPLTIADPADATVTQRPSVDLSLLSGASAQTAGLALGGSISIGRGASITVDPGATIELASGGQISVDGSLTAAGGAIDILNNRPLGGTPDSGDGVSPGSLSILIGSGARLDVSAKAFTATDERGRRFGIVPDGGTITLGGDGGANGSNATDAFVIIRPGARLDASGTSATLDMASGFPATSTALLVPSDGGTIALRSNSGIILDGDAVARSGGAGAAGGTLDVALESPVYVSPFGDPIPLAVQAGRVLTISQTGTPGDAMPALGTGRVAADTITAGGFDSVSLLGRTAVAFDGDVALTVGRSLTLSGGPIYDTVAGGTVALSAPYVLLGGQNTLGTGFTGTVVVPSILPTYPEGGRLSVNADLLDVRNTVVSQFARTALESAGDLRFLATSGVVSGSGNLLAAEGDLDLTAVQIYPQSNTAATIIAGVTTFDPVGNRASAIDPDAVLTIASVGGATPATPYSVFGSLTLQAGTIRQGGVLRAPLGAITLNAATASNSTYRPPSQIELLPGSITSVSAAGLTMPYGGTVDGTHYTVDGGAPVAPSLIGGTIGASQNVGVTLIGATVAVDDGALLDLSGGGALTGAGFVSGRGGSVDVLTTPLANANPGHRFSAASNQVYAIVPGATVAPPVGGAASAWTGATPGIGEQVTIPAGVPGLAAGTYTLMPANYALLPGAYRVELASQTTIAGGGVVATGSGSYLLSGYTGVANTGIRDVLPTTMVVTPGATIRSASQYNEQSYDAFELAQAQTFGTVRPLLEADGKLLDIQYQPLVSDADVPAGPALSFAGKADFTAAKGGYDGGLALTTGQIFGPFGPLSNNLEITAADSDVQRTATLVPISAATIDAIGAPAIWIGGTPTLNGTSVILGQGFFPSVVDAGAKLTGSQIIFSQLTSLGDGAEISTLGQGYNLPDSSLGFSFVGDLIVSNGQIRAVPSAQGGTMTIGDGASILAEGSIAFAGSDTPAFAGTFHLGARSLDLAVGAINIGSSDALAAAAQAGILPAGLNLDTGLLDALLAGGNGAPATEQLILGAASSVNTFGSVDLDTIDPATGKSRLKELVLNSPAIYGYGDAGDTVNLTTDTLVWSVGQQLTLTADGEYLPVSSVPGALRPGGAGSGHGVFNVNASNIVLGYSDQIQPDPTLGFDRLILGYSAVNLNASQSITSNARGSLLVYESGANPTSAYTPDGYAGTGGALSLNTPLLTGVAGSTITYKTGSALTLATPSGGVADTAGLSALGAEIDLVGGSITAANSIYLPSGKLSMTAAGAIVLTGTSHIDLSGQTIPLLDVTQYSWGGDALFESTAGNITQQAGSIIDVSATHETGGSLSFTATGAGAGAVLLGGSLTGGGTTGGSIDIRAQRLGSDLTADFATLNTALAAGGFTDGLSLDVKQGDLTIAQGQIVKAQQVALSIDGGALTVAGTIDASGAKPGEIRLASAGDLTLAPTALLDAHGSVLQVDSYGAPIDAENRGHVELTTAGGVLTLDPGATIDLSSADGVARGELVLNAPRTGSSAASATGADGPANAAGTGIAIAATGPLAIAGAATIALNGTATYTNAPYLNGDPATDTQVIDQPWLDTVDQDSQAYVANLYGGNVASGQLAAPLQAQLAGLLSYGSAVHLRPGVEIASKTADGNLVTSGDIDLAAYRYGPGADRDPASATYGAGEPLALTVRAGGDFTANGSISDGFKPATLLPPVYTGLVTDVTTQSDFTEYDSTPDGTPGAIYYSFTPYYLTADYNFPDDPVTQLNGGQTDSNGNYYAPGSLIPAGTLFTSFVYFEAGTSIPALATSFTPGQPKQGDPLSSGTKSASIRLVSGADIKAADTRTLRAKSDLDRFAVPGSTTYSGVIPNISHSDAFSLAGAGDDRLRGAPGSAFVGTQDLYLTNDWTIPIDAFWATYGYVQDVNGGIYYSGQLVPAGTQLSAAAGFAFENVQQAPGVATGAPVVVAPRPGKGQMVLAGSGTNAADVSLTSGQLNAIRTGTGDLDLVAGGDFSEGAPYGVYTAGTPVALGADQAAFSSLGSYPDGGGDLFVRAQGNLTGQIVRSNSSTSVDSSLATNWLFRQGDGGATPTAWAINFNDVSVPFFSGFGTFGGGNLTLLVDGDAGRLSPADTPGALNYVTDGLVLAVGSTGRVTSVQTYSQGSVTGGTVAETGGGDMTVKIGGRLNPGAPPILTYQSGGSYVTGSLADTRGAVTLRAGAIGGMAPIYGTANRNDPRAADADTAQVVFRLYGAPTIVAGDSATTIETRGDLLLNGVSDPGLLPQPGSAASQDWFSLWRPNTSVSLVSAGGDIVPTILGTAGTNLPVLTVPIFKAVSDSGSMYLAGAAGNSAYELELAPSSVGQLTLLAMDSIYGGGVASGQGGGSYAVPSGTTLLMSGLDDILNVTANPFKPATASTSSKTGNLFAFGDDTASSTLHQADSDPMRVYAATGDIVDLALGDVFQAADGNLFSEIGAKSAQVRAGRDIVNFGNLTDNNGRIEDPAFIVNTGDTDVSVISAGRDIFYARVDVAGPGELDVSAGRNLYQADQGAITSIGLIGDAAIANPGGGASIVAMAGVGANGPDYADFATLYLDDANLADVAIPDDDPRNAGKVPATYGDALVTWLKGRFGYAGTKADALATFLALPKEQQGIFVRQTFYKELDAGGKEYNDPSSKRFQSYLRGRDAIATLFPAKDASGNAISYAGDLTMFGPSGIQTQFGGSIDVLAPGGQIVVGVEGANPPATAGIITQGQGDISIYSLKSVLLGQSRIMTTFGGNILVWSAEGDINAGRGAKTTTVFNPPRRLYDAVGNVTVSPTVPSEGAGIATLDPIPEVAPGNINLVAPLGTIDAGEAGIRVSGNVNLAALQVVNAANIQVKGNASGLPAAVAVNTGALTAASSAASAVSTEAERLAERARPQLVPTDIPSIVTGRLLGFGEGI